MTTHFKNTISIGLQRVMAIICAAVMVFSGPVPLARAADLGWRDLAPGEMIGPSRTFSPVLLKGMILDPNDPLRFQFVVDSGSLDMTSAQVKSASQKLVRYFMSGLTIPKSELWVNLSPYEGDRIITAELSRTELGQDLLVQDYLLKQLTSTLIYPEDDLGEEFWQRIYTKAHEQYGVSELPIATFNKVWVLPEKAVIAEHGLSVEIVESRLKVMLDRDYVAMQANGKKTDNQADEDLNVLSSTVLRDLIVPEIEKEINNGENFAALRQIYHSLILAKWYKETITNSLLSQVYVDRQKVLGIDLADPDIREKVYRRYLDAFQIGVFDYVREEYDSYSHEMIPRKYFSGGITRLLNMPLTRDVSGREVPITGERFILDIGTFPRYQGDKAVLGESGSQEPLVREVRVFDLFFSEAQKERRWRRDELVPLGEAVDALLEKFAGRDVPIERSDIENYLINTPGYPVEGNVHLAKTPTLLRGVSKGLEGVGIGRATFFEREDVQFQYPFVAPNNTAEVRDQKVSNEKRLVGEIFQGAFRAESELAAGAVLDRVINATSALIQEQVENRMEFAYRLVHELVRKSKEDFLIELGLGEEEVPADFIDEFKKELLNIYIPRLVEAHAESPEYVTVFGDNYALYQRLKLMRGAWAVLLTHPYGLDRMREYYQLLQDYVRFQELHDEQIRKSDEEKDEPRIARLRLEMERINWRLKTLHKEIEGLQQSMQAQKSMFFFEFLRKTLQKSGEEHGNNAFAMIQAHRKEMDAFFEMMRQGGTLPRNMEAIKEAYTAFTFVQDHLDSHAYVIAYEDAPDLKEQKINLEIGRFLSVLRRARELFVREQLRLEAARKDDYNGQYYGEILKGLESESATAVALSDGGSLFSRFLDSFAEYVQGRISQRGVTIERGMINYMAFAHDDDLLAAAGDRVKLPEFADASDKERFRDMTVEFMMIFSQLLKEETIQQATEPMVVFVDPSIEALTPNEVGTIHVKFPNIVAIVEQGRSPHAINQFPLSVSGVSGFTKANIKEGELTIVEGSSRGLGGVTVRPDLKTRVAAYQLSEDLDRRREYFNVVAAKPLKIGGRTYQSFTSIGVNHREDLRRMNALGIPNVGLHRLELMFEDPYRPDLRNQERQMAQEFENILNEEVFSGDLGDGVLGRYIPRLDDIGGEKVPQILSDYLAKVEAAEGKGRREELKKEILTEYSGTAFYFYRDAGGERPFYEYGLRQLRALFRAYHKATNKRLGLTFPNVRVIPGVVGVDDILAMVDEAKQQAAQALFEEEREELADRIAKLREQTTGETADGETTDEERRAHEERVRELDILDERLNYFTEDHDIFISRLIKAFEGVQIGFYVEDVREIPHYDEMVRKSDFIAIGTNDMTQSLFRRDFPKLTRFDSRYSHLFDEMQPRLLEVNWLMARISARHRKPLLISGDWGDTVRWGGFVGTALSQRYSADVYPVSSISKAARIRAYMREISVGRLTKVPDSESEGIFSEMFARLEAAYADGLNEFRDVLHGAEEEYLAPVQKLRESLDPVIESKVREMSGTSEGSDKALLAREETADNVGGIDLNEIQLQRAEAAIRIEFDPAKVEAILDAGVIDGFTPVIINVAPMPVLLPLAGGDSRDQLLLDGSVGEFSARRDDPLQPQT